LFQLRLSVLSLSGRWAFRPSRHKVDGHMVEITRNIVGPGRKVYKAVIVQAANMSEVADVVSKSGISLEALNDALKEAIKVRYLSGLSSTVESRIEKAVAAMMDMGYDKEQATILASANRSKLDKGLPEGLTPVLEADGSHRISQRGVKDDAAPTTEVPPTA